MWSKADDEFQKILDRVKAQTSLEGSSITTRES